MLWRAHQMWDGTEVRGVHCGTVRLVRRVYKDGPSKF